MKEDRSSSGHPATSPTWDAVDKVMENDDERHIPFILTGDRWGADRICPNVPDEG